MLITILVATAMLAQQPAKPAEPEVTVLKAGLGPCSAEFTVTDADGQPVYAALVHVRVRYGFLGVKRADLEVGTSSDGKARIVELPAKAKPLTYDIQHGDKKAVVEQDLAKACEAKYDVTLK
jgi:hypothetical protein